MTNARAFSTCDLCDAQISDDSGDFRVLPPVFRSLGGHAYFAGEVRTVQCLDDNSLVRAALAEPGLGRVLVVDGGGSLAPCAGGRQCGGLCGQKRLGGRAGLWLRARCGRACATPVGLYALALNPMPTVKRQGLRDVAVQIAGVPAQRRLVVCGRGRYCRQPPQSHGLMRVVINFDSCQRLTDMRLGQVAITTLVSAIANARDCMPLMRSPSASMPISAALMGSSTVKMPA